MLVILTTVKQKVGSQLFVLVAEHVRLKDHLTIEAESFQLNQGYQLCTLATDQLQNWNKETYPLDGRCLGFSQVDLHDLWTQKVFFVPLAFALWCGAQELVQCLWVLRNELGELRVARGDLLEEGLDQCRVLLDHLQRVSLGATVDHAARDLEMVTDLSQLLDLWRVGQSAHGFSQSSSTQSASSSSCACSCSTSGHPTVPVHWWSAWSHVHRIDELTSCLSRLNTGQCELNRGVAVGKLTAKRFSGDPPPPAGVGVACGAAAAGAGAAAPAPAAGEGVAGVCQSATIASPAARMNELAHLGNGWRGWTRLLNLGNLSLELSALRSPHGQSPLSGMRELTLMRYSTARSGLLKLAFIARMT